MGETEKHPWPASWPPLWRNVLHIAIATAVGNIVFGAGSTAGEYRRVLRTDEDSLVSVLLTALALMAALLLVALCCALLMRAKRRTLVALLAASFLGILTILNAECVVYFLLSQGRPWLYPIGTLVWASAGFAVIVWLFTRICRQARRRLVMMVLILGPVLYSVAALNAIMAQWRFVTWGGRYGWLIEDFLTNIAQFVLYPLAFAITSMMLIRAADDEEGK